MKRQQHRRAWSLGEVEVERLFVPAPAFRAPISIRYSSPKGGGAGSRHAVSAYYSVSLPIPDSVSASPANASLRYLLRG